MHEWGLTRRLLQVIEDQARARQLTRVSRVRLIGALSAAECEALRFNFQAAARGTVAQDAELDITAGPMPGRCPVCRAEVEMTDHHQACTHCQSQPLIPVGEILRVTELVAT